MRYSSFLAGAILLVFPLVQVVAAPPSGFPSRRPTNVQAQENNGIGTVKQLETRKAVLSRMVSKFRMRLDNYRRFLTKVQSRIDRLKEDGHNVSRFTRYITLANTNITATEQAIDHMEQTLAAFSDSMDMKTVRKAVQVESRKVREAFTKLHTTMKQVVDLIASEQE